jgi:antitoxin YefM
MDELQKILPVTKVKHELLDILKAMEREYATITLTRNGEPVGVMMTPERYESLIETIEILSDKAVMRDLKASRRDFQSGKVYDHDEVWQDE